MPEGRAIGTDVDDIEFAGTPFDALAWSVTTMEPPASVPPAPAVHNPASHLGAGPATGPHTVGAHVAALARDLRESLIETHASALRAQFALALRLVDSLAQGDAAARPAVGRYFQVVDGRAVAVDHLPPAPEPVLVCAEAAFKPLARPDGVRWGTAELVRLAGGHIAGVFGVEYDQDEANPSVRLAPEGDLLLSDVLNVERRGGSWGAGRLLASTTALAGSPEALVDAVAQAAQFVALHHGLHLCLVDAVFVRGMPDGEPASAPVFVEIAEPTEVVDGPLALTLDVTGIDLVPRPWVRVDAEFRADGRPVAWVRDLVVALREKPGVPIGPELGGTVPRWLGRKGRFGGRAMLSEFHFAHSTLGDQGIAFGPEFATYTGRKATRPPSHGLRLVDRLMALEGKRGELDGGATYQAEYDSPADSWYYADTANASMPNVIYMETSLQAALVVGYYLGATLFDPEATVSLRNLGGTATVLREVELRDQTISQHSELLSTSLLPGATLQEFSYRQSVDGQPYYEGTTLFGYFSDQAMANQTGLDGGRDVPTWLDEQHPAPPTRVIDVAARRADPSARLCSRAHFALLNHVEVVDGGGRYGQGYLRATQPIDPTSWFFARHFYLDPVIPGSLGVETVIQAMQEWLLDSGEADDLTDPEFVMPVGLPFTWKYRGQFLPTDGTCTFEAHIKDVRRTAGRIRVTGDASLWKPGLRIYELTDIAVELRERGAPEW